MESEAHQWEVKAVQNRNEYLNLTFEQAEQIYQYEQIKSNFPSKHSFSQWEDWDYELSTYREILVENQLHDYETSLRINTEQYVQFLIDQDREKSAELSDIMEKLGFYKNQFLPAVFKDPNLMFLGWLISERSKTDFLKAEYLRFLNDQRKKILVEHFRNSRTFQPNTLKVSLLRHKIWSVVPAYFLFKNSMDEPTKVIADFLKSRLQHLPDEMEMALSMRFNELKEFNRAAFQLHGWHVGNTETPEQERENMVMTLLLVDKNRYGF